MSNSSVAFTAYFFRMSFLVLIYVCKLFLFPFSFSMFNLLAMVEILQNLVAQNLENLNYVIVDTVPYVSKLVLHAHVRNCCLTS